MIRQAPFWLCVLGLACVVIAFFFEQMGAHPPALALALAVLAAILSACAGFAMLWQEIRR